LDQLTTPEGRLPDLHPSRRIAIASLFTAGYALSVGPAHAQAITTPETGLIIEEIRFPGFNGYQMPAYVARPQGAGRRPAIIVINEIFGIHAYVKDVCRRLAQQGYVAIAPDYFDRAGDPSILTDLAQIRLIVATATHLQVLGDTEGAIHWLRTRRFVAGGKIGVTGFCWGGAIVWLACARLAHVKAGVAWYGRLVPRQPGEFGYTEDQLSPLGEAGNLKAPVLGLYAENDQGIALDTVAQMRTALAANGNPTGSRIDVFPATQHGFHADYRQQYAPAAAADAWGRMLVWFDRALGER
jgi:carboxymethylenebutenolidase